MKFSTPESPIGRTIPAALALTLLCTAAVGAQAAPPGGQDRFPISVAEAEAHRAEIFAGLDSDGDGRISTEEFAAAEVPRGFRHGMKPPHPMAHERGRDEPDEARREARMTARDDALFAALDTDGNGTLSRAEFSHQAMARAMTEGMQHRLFERADADGDGYLSPEEFPPRRLAELDANGDGQITRDEMPRHPRATRS